MDSIISNENTMYGGRPYIEKSLVKPIKKQ